MPLCFLPLASSMRSEEQKLVFPREEGILPQDRDIEILVCEFWTQDYSIESC